MLLYLKIDVITRCKKRVFSSYFEWAWNKCCDIFRAMA